MCKPSLADSPLSVPEHPDLAALAARLRAALEALAPFASAFDAPAPHAAADGGIAPERNHEANAPAEGADLAGQLRTYRVSPDVLATEREHLALFGVEDSFIHLMHLLERFSVTVTLMEQIDSTRGLPEDFIQMLGWHIRGFLDSLQTIAGILIQMELIHTQTVE